MGSLTLLAIVGLALGVGRVTRSTYAPAFLFAVAAAVLALYFSALAGVLWWMALAIHIAGVTLLGYEALRRARETTAFALPVPFGVLALLCSWFFVVHGADQYFLYDEYSHWGIFVKEMLALDGFWTGDTSSIHPRYPPAAPLWQYLFNAFLPPSEAKTYFAHFVLLIAPLLMLWTSVRWSQPLWVLAILALVLIATANFGLGVSTLYVDQTIAVWYLGTLLAAIADEQIASKRVALYALPLSVIALLKDAGFAFALSGAAIIAAVFCHRARYSLDSPRVLLKTGAAIGLLVAPMLLCSQLWSWNRDAVGAPHDVYSVSGILSGIADAPNVEKTVDDTEVERRLSEIFFEQQISNSSVSWEHNEFTYQIRHLYEDSHRLTTFTLLVAFVGWWWLMAYLLAAGESRRRWMIIACGVLFTAIAYITTLHASYRFAFSARGLDLPSYVRYVHVIALPMFLLSFCPLLPGFREAGQHRTWRLRGWSVSKRTSLFAVAIVAAYGIETPYLPPILKPNPAIERRTTIEPLLDSIRESVGSSRLWIYFPGEEESDFFYRMVQYLLAPTRTSVESSERFLQAENAAGIADAWRPFDYVWIAELPSVDAGVGLARFTGGIAAPGLYRVRSSNEGVFLKPLDENRYAD